MATTTIYSEFEFSNLIVRYLLDNGTGKIGLQLLPKSKLDSLVEHRNDILEIKGMVELVEHLPIPTEAWTVQPLVEFSLAGDVKTPGFAQGETLRGGSASAEARFVAQRRIDDDRSTTVTTESFAENNGIRIVHHLRHLRGLPILESWSEITNVSDQNATLEMATSVNMGHITPFDRADAPNKLYLHRIRAAWSAEGRRDTRSLEELSLERSWSGHSMMAERFGSVGTKPVKKWFPFAALEDRGANVFWGAALAWAGSWQMEVFRKDDFVGLSAGLADREFGHWTKTLPPGETLTTPKAYISASDESFEDLCANLKTIQESPGVKRPAMEKDLPIVANEWCSSWGHPSKENLTPFAEAAKKLGCRYLVIDAGWYANRDGVWDSSQGDWIPNPNAFPDGLEAACEAIREMGLVPGLWFEPEVAGENSNAWNHTEMLLTRDGRPLQVDGRRFLDLRKKEAWEHLENTMFRLIEKCRVGYVKLDYNETVGVGVDDPDSLGEGLRRHVMGVYRMFDEIRKRFPDMVIENCSSGGQRMEPSLISRSDMTSFSDAHETESIPVIAANLAMTIPPSLSQIWAVLRRGDDERRLIYSLAATFLGRMCLSGDLQNLEPWQTEKARKAVKLYSRTAEIIKHGVSRRHGDIPTSYNNPEGWQAVERHNEKNGKTLLVVHKFKCSNASLKITLKHSLEGTPRIAESLAPKNVEMKTDGRVVEICGLEHFSGCVAVLDTR